MGVSTFYPFKELISSTCIESFFLKNVTIIAKPTAASAAETLKLTAQDCLKHNIIDHIV